MCSQMFGAVRGGGGGGGKRGAGKALTEGNQQIYGKDLSPFQFSLC